MNEVALVALVLAACIFGVSSVSKLHRKEVYQSYLAGLRDTQLITRSKLPFTAAFLVSCEVTAAVTSAGALVALATSVPGAGIGAQSALGVSAALTSVLTLGVAAIIKRGTKARCACFGGTSRRPLSRVHLLRNGSLLILLAAGLGCALASGRDPGPLPLASLLAVIAGGLVAAPVFIRWEELAELFSPLRLAGPTPRIIAAAKITPDAALTEGVPASRAPGAPK
jgi:hypothetical protein